jgi:hypothetical protein
MHAGTCAMGSASFTDLPKLKADATGRATATCPMLFHGTINVALAAIADGEHIIVIHVDRLVACGVIPRPASRRCR